MNKTKADAHEIISTEIQALLTELENNDSLEEIEQKVADGDVLTDEEKALYNRKIKLLDLQSGRSTDIAALGDLQ